MECSKHTKCCICGGNGAWYKYPDKNTWDEKSFACNICYLREYRKREKKININNCRYSNLPDNILNDIKCCQCEESLKNLRYCRYKDKNGNWDKKSFICNTCYQKEYRKRYPDIVKRHNNELCRASNWKIGELDPYTSSGKGYIIEQFCCKTLGVKNFNVENNSFLSKYDAIKHPVYGNIQIKGASYNIIERSWNRTIGEAGLGQDFDTLIFACMDRYMPWKNVERIYAIPEIDIYGKRSVTIYKYPSPSLGSKWEDYIIDEKPFNESYHNLTIEDCPSLRRDRFEEWLRLTRA